MHKIAIAANNKPETQDVYKKLHQAIVASDALQIDDDHPDIAISIGGDGTLMSAFHKYFESNNQIGLIGIHTGHLGFYTWHDLPIEKIINTLSQPKISMTLVPLLQATVTLENGEKAVLTALNEITFRRSIQTIKADIQLNNDLFEKFNGDGLCVSTPTGSTAYNKSLGGAIVSPTLKAIQMSEMSSINNRVYRTISSSIVIGESESITVIPKPGLEDYYFIGVDGKEFKHNSPIKEIRYEVAPKEANFVTFKGPAFWERVDKSFIGTENND
jgi:NAD+ kinase